jgi:hypothetical protein
LWKLLKLAGLRHGVPGYGQLLETVTEN